MTDIEKLLVSLLEEERAKNFVLVTCILNYTGMLPRDKEVIVPGKDSVGKKSWRELRVDLERKYSKKSGTGDSEEAESQETSEDVEGTHADNKIGETI